MSKQLPSRETALKILANAGCSKHVIKHSKEVADSAVEIAQACKKKGLDVDVALVQAGALLHDVGRAKTHNVDHNIVGAQIAKHRNLSSAVVSIIERHVGGGITQSEAKSLGWPPKSYIPETIEERIVAYADKLIDGSRQIPAKVAAQRLRQDKNVQEDAIRRFQQWHKEFSVCRK
ncbi:MAG: HDIG domain-containing protein [Candidatus Bathyarchaeota archaeon]|nr:MAG: HDIG domain-containing protein [Candidatus Bathyarchaeota archaeon]